MRVSRLDLRRLRYEDDGAVVMIVAVTMIVLIGMLTLTFDIGRTVAVRRDMVNASDSAVLAAVQTCASPGGTQAAAEAVARDLIAENSTNLDSTAMTSFDAPQCEVLDGNLKYVSVSARTEVDY